MDELCPELKIEILSNLKPSDLWSFAQTNNYYFNFIEKNLNFYIKKNFFPGEININETNVNSLSFDLSDHLSEYNKYNLILFGKFYRNSNILGPGFVKIVGDATDTHGNNIKIEIDVDLYISLNDEIYTLNIKDILNLKEQIDVVEDEQIVQLTQYKKVLYENGIKKYDLFFNYKLVGALYMNYLIFKKYNSNENLIEHHVYYFDHENSPDGLQNWDIIYNFLTKINLTLELKDFIDNLNNGNVQLLITHKFMIVNFAAQSIIRKWPKSTSIITWLCVEEMYLITYYGLDDINKQIVYDLNELFNAIKL